VIFSPKAARLVQLWVRYGSKAAEPPPSRRCPSDRHVASGGTCMHWSSFSGHSVAIMLDTCRSVMASRKCSTTAGSSLSPDHSRRAQWERRQRRRGVTSRRAAELRVRATLTARGRVYAPLTRRHGEEEDGVRSVLREVRRRHAQPGIVEHLQECAWCAYARGNAHSSSISLPASWSSSTTDPQQVNIKAVGRWRWSKPTFSVRFSSFTCA
jgi:hypothetical protein